MYSLINNFIISLWIHEYFIIWVLIKCYCYQAPWKKPWCWERLKAGGEGDDRGWDGWIASPIRWTWVWASSESWRWTGKPGVLQSMRSQRVGPNWMTEMISICQSKYSLWELEVLSGWIIYHAPCFLGNTSLITDTPNCSRFILYFISVQFNHSVMSDCLWLHGLACQASLSITNSQSLLKSCPLNQWCHQTISSSVIPFSSCLQSYPKSGSFQMTQLCASGGQSTGVSASTSVLPMNIQDLFPFGLTGWNSLQSRGLSRVFSNTILQKHQFFSTQLFFYSNTYIHTWLLEKP